MRPITSFVTFLALLVLTSQLALADVPSPFNWLIPSHVRIVGVGSAGPDSVLGHVECVIRDLAMNPMPGAIVTFDFYECTDLVLASDQQDPRLSVNCAYRGVSAVTDEHGIARFTILGAGTQEPAHAPHSLNVYADGVFAGSPSVAVFERDGAGGLTLADLAYWTLDLFSGEYVERADLDGSGDVSIADLSVWAAAYFNGNNAFIAGPYCP